MTILSVLGLAVLILFTFTLVLYANWRLRLWIARQCCDTEEEAIALAKEIG